MNMNESNLNITIRNADKINYSFLLFLDFSEYVTHT